MGSGHRLWLALYRAEKADPERIYRKLQWQAARRMPEGNAPQLTGRGQRNAGSMAEGLQHPQTTFGVQQPDTDGICRENDNGQTGRARSSTNPQGPSAMWRKLGAQVSVVGSKRVMALGLSWVPPLVTNPMP